MAGHRSFLFPEARREAGALVLDGRESHHLVRVVRARAGDAVEVLDGAGARYLGRLARADSKAARIEVERIERAEAARPRITLVQAVPKGKAMETILRMATEIGVWRIEPVFTEHGEVRMSGARATGKLEKWRATTVEACKQCGLPFLPEVAAPVPLDGALAGGRAALGLVASLEAGSRPLAEVLGEAAGGSPEDLRVAVGPEGDFSEREYGLLREAGFRPVRLGANVLRAETAAAYLLSVVDQLLRAGAR